MNAIVFGEFVWSSDFFALFKHTLELFDRSIGLGSYLQGFPLRPTNDFVWGTVAGVRVIPLLLSLSILQHIFENWVWVFGLISVVLPFVCFLHALKQIKRINFMTLLGAMFYSLNAWIVHKFFTGVWFQLIAYAFLPYLITLPIAYDKLPSLKKLFSFSLIVSVIIWINPLYLVIMFPYILGLVIKKVVTNSNLRNFTIFGVFSGLLILVYNIFYWAPAVFFPEHSFTFSVQDYSIPSIEYNSRNIHLFDALSLNVGGHTEWYMLSATLIIGYFFWKSNKKEWEFILWMLVFVYLGKGINSPGYLTSKFIYSHIPLLIYARDPSRFLAGAALFGALIISNSNAGITSLGHKVKWMILLILTLVLSNMDIFTSSRYFELLKPVMIPDEYKDLQSYLHNDSGRILIFPQPVGMQSYSWYHNPSPVWANNVFESLVPIASTVINQREYFDSPSNSVNQYLTGEAVRTKNIDLLKPLGLNYILTDKYIDGFNWDTSWFGNIPVVFKSENLLLRKLGDQSLTNSSKPLFVIGQLTNLKITQDRPVILLNQNINAELSLSTVLKGEDLLIDIPNSSLVLTGERLLPEYNLNILKSSINSFSSFSNGEVGKQSYEKRGQLLTSGAAVRADKTGSLNIPIALKKGQYKLLIKFTTDSSTSEMDLRINGQNNFYKLFNKDDLIWMDLGTISINKNSQEITISKLNLGNILIDGLLLIPQQRFENELAKTNYTIAGMNLVSDPIATKTVSSKYLTDKVSFGNGWISQFPSEKFLSNGYGMTFIAKGSFVGSISYKPARWFGLFLAISLVSFIGSVFYLLASTITVKPDLLVLKLSKLMRRSRKG